MTNLDELATLDATDQAELVRRKEATPSELVDAACERLERLNPELNAVTTVDLDRARVRAKDAALPDGPFRGVPFLMKDIGGDEAGQPYHAGMRFLKEADYRAPRDSYFSEKIAAAGLISLGRTATSELAILPSVETAAYGPTRNPWNLEHSSGGSSGGTGSAVAAGIVPMAHGSDGGGSIRIPAAHCGLVGLKPTRGRCSFGPGAGERWSGLSSEFALTRSVRDTAALLDQVAGPMPGDPYSASAPETPFAKAAARPPRRLRIGFIDYAPRDIEMHPGCVETVRSTARLLEDLGHDVVDSHPVALDDKELVVHYVNIVAGNISQSLVSWGEKVGREIEEGDVEPLTWALAQRGQSLTAQEFLATLDYVHSFGRRLASWWEEGFDLLLTPSTAQPAPKLGNIVSTPEEPLKAYFLSAPYGVFTLPHNISGQPGISLPLGVSNDGLPIGSQLVGRVGDEAGLLSVATQIEGAAPWCEKRPALFG
jgi:amidase